jgi:hypothetical protein
VGSGAEAVAGESIEAKFLPGFSVCRFADAFAVET